MFLLLPVMPTGAVSGRSGLTRAGFPTETHSHWSSEEAHFVLGRRVCALRERNRFRKNSVLSLEALFWLQLV
jgi:hypothetical protein